METLPSEGAERRSRRLKVPHLRVKVYAGVRCGDGAEAIREVVV
jgi:hypothetical protein